MSEDGLIDKVKGRLREAAGALLDDDNLKRQGQVDKAAGQAKEKAGDVVDKARDAVTGDDRSSS